MAHVAANQIGKTLGLAVLLLWACLFKIGYDPTHPKEWLQRPYLWLHLAPTQLQAYHALNDARLLIKGAHPGQKGMFRLPAGLVQESKVEQYYNGLIFWNGAIAQFRTAENKAEAILGYRAAAISLDEAAFQDYLIATVNETLMMRLVSTGGPFFPVSTPAGMNEWFDYVEAIRSIGKEIEDRVWAAGDAALVWSVITDNVGYGIAQAEVDRMEATLDPATKEQQLRGAFLNPPEAFFTPTSAILRSFPDGRRALPLEEGPKPGHRYIAFWDPSVSSDPTAVVVLDVTKKPWRGVYFRYWAQPMEITELLGEITKVHLLYNSARDMRRILPKSACTTAYDATAMGGVIVGQLMRAIDPKRPLNFGGPGKKLEILTNARAALSKQDVLLPLWTQLRTEVLNYKLADSKIKQDACMALVGAIFCGNGVSSGARSRKFNPHALISPNPRTTWR